jgi:hypothetical protein
VDQVRQRAHRDQQRLDSGAVTSPKDLENLQHEITSLAKRQGDLEDVVLEVMERRESAQERVAELTERTSSVQSKIDDATGRRDAAFESLDGEIASVTKEREVVAASVPADLLKLYDKLRQQQGGVGAARLYQRRCEGCRLELNITEVNDVKAASPDTVLRCENCRRILVRTSESGLSRPTAGPGATRDPRGTAPWSSTRPRGRRWRSVPSTSASPPTTSPSTGAWWRACAPPTNWTRPRASGSGWTPSSSSSSCPAAGRSSTRT